MVDYERGKTAPDSIGDIAVARLIGEPRKLDLDADEDRLKDIIALTEIDNPLKQMRPDTVELSFLSAENEQRVKKGLAPEREFKLFQFRTVRYDLLRAASKAEDDVDRDESRAGPLIDNLEEDISQLLESNDIYDRTAIVQKVRDYLVDLETIADQMPSLATADTIIKIAESVLQDKRREEAFRQRKGQTLGMGKLLDKYDEAAKATHKTLTSHKTQIQELYKRGNEIYRQLAGILSGIGSQMALELLTKIAETTSILARNTGVQNVQELQELRAAEQYLAQKMFYAESVLRRLNPRSLERIESRNTLQSLGFEALTQAASTELQSKAQNSLRPLSSQLSEARDILLGGRRLGGKKETELRDKADLLYRLKVDGDKKMLQPEEAGLILAITTGRFERFLHTINKVHGEDKEVEMIKEMRGSALIEDIRSFDLAAAIKNLRTLLADPSSRVEIATVISDVEIRQIETVIDGFLEQ